MFITILDQVPFLSMPAGSGGWSLWVGLWGLLIAILWQAWRFHPTWGRRQWFLFLLLIFLSPLGALFLGYKLPDTGILPIPELPVSVLPPIVMFLSAFTWLFAAGLLGPVPAVIIAMLTGLMVALFSGGTVFAPLIYGLVAIGLSILLRQRYRTVFFRMLSRPMLAAFLLSLLYPIIHASALMFVIDELFTVRLDYALSRVMMDSVAFAIPLLSAGAFAEVLAFGMPRLWYGNDQLEPSPAESSLQGRLMFVMAPLIIVWMLILMIGDWVIASTTAREMIDNQMNITAQNVADGIPFFLETGHSLISQMAANPVLVEGGIEDIQSILHESISSLPYFTDVSYWRDASIMIASYPETGGLPISLSQVEYQAIDRALNLGVPFQFYTLPHTIQYDVRIVFVANVESSDPSSPGGVLIAHTELNKNPLTESLLVHLDSIVDIGGAGALIDDNGMIIYHTDGAFIGEDFSGERGLVEQHQVVTSPQGTRELQVYLPSTGYSWAVITMVPIREAQITALEIALPVLGLFALMAIASYLVLRFWVQMVTGSLKQLTVETGRIAAGNFNHPLDLDSADEVGQLGRSFEQMRLNLKSQIDEISRLLSVSQGMASAIEMKTLMEPILQGALSIGASSARIILDVDYISGFDEVDDTQFGLGHSSERFATLDPQVLNMSAQQAQIVLSNPVRARLVPPDGVPPASLIAIALHQEKEHIGVLWVAFDQPRNIIKEDVQFIKTIANQAALSITNALLYRSARVGRERVEAVLAATPDPVLVTDHRNRLLTINPAGLDLLDLIAPIGNDLLVSDVIKNSELLELLSVLNAEPNSVEISFGAEKIFNVSIAPVFVEGGLKGQVCVLHDISQFKALDALKTEFVSTVSHDLRSPLTVIQGYVTMLKMVGELNEQQIGYTKKIEVGINRTKGLVDDLLDLGRIDAGVGLRLAMVPVSDIARQVVEILEPEATQKRIQLELNLPTQTMPLVEADQALLQQAVHNLVENAIKYTKPEGSIVLTVTVEDDGVLFAIKDSGIGVAPIDQAHLFERFYRAAGRESRKERGSGLGLAIVKSIAEKHGGHVKLESQLGVGSTFSIFIPLRQSQSEVH